MVYLALRCACLVLVTISPQRFGLLSFLSLWLKPLFYLVLPQKSLLVRALVVLSFSLSLVPWCLTLNFGLRVGTLCLTKPSVSVSV